MSQILIDTLTEKLKTALDAQHVAVVDNTWQHAGHSGAAGGSHVDITIVSPKFQDTLLLDRHRIVHQALKAEMSTFIHALQLQVFTPEEWAHKNEVQPSSRY